MTLLVGLGAGILATFVSISLRITHERESDLRLRMLESAERFGEVAYRGVDAIREFKSERLFAAHARSLVVKAPSTMPTPTLTPPIDLAQARDLIDELMGIEARVRLLFGPDSGTASAALVFRKQMHEDFEEERTAIASEIEEGANDITVADAHALIAKLDAFSAAAHRDLRRGSVFGRQQTPLKSGARTFR